MPTRRLALFAPAVFSTAIALTLGGCGGGDGGGAALGPGSGGNGVVSIALTDAPVDFASHVFVEFTGIELTPQTGNRITLDVNPDRAVDLLTLQDGVTLTLLQNQSVPAGNYTRVRFIVNAQSNNAYVDLVTGERYPLVIPSGSDAGLTIDRNFTVAKDGRVDLTADFDLRKSLVSAVSATGNYAFKPVVRLLDSASVGTISGTVGPNFVNGICNPYVYVFTGANVVPDDIDLASDIDPLVSVPVKLNNTSGTYTYRASFLEAGNYTLSFVCLNPNGPQDDPELDEQLGFVRALQATVVAGQTATVDFSS
jgi:hypothetical protein